MARGLSILHLEDNPFDAELIERVISKDRRAYEIRRVDTKEGFTESLTQWCCDIILADYSLPSFDGLAALRIASEQSPGTPFIFVSGMLNEETALESLKLGATDYVFKHNLRRLIPCINRAMQEVADARVRKLTQTTLYQRAVAEAAARMKSECLVNMSHELRTQLTCIIDVAELMRAEKAGAISEIHKEYLTDMSRRANYMLQLLDLSVLEKGKNEVDSQSID
jgi:CheY-like chemotaxis protein